MTWWDKSDLFFSYTQNTKLLFSLLKLFMKKKCFLISTLNYKTNFHKYLWKIKNLYSQNRRWRKLLLSFVVLFSFSVAVYDIATDLACGLNHRVFLAQFSWVRIQALVSRVLCGWSRLAAVKVSAGSTLVWHMFLFQLVQVAGWKWLLTFVALSWLVSLLAEGWGLLSVPSSRVALTGQWERAHFLVSLLSGH